MDSAGKILKKHFDRQFKVIDECDVVWVKDKYSHSYDVLEMVKYLLENDDELKNLSEEYKEYGRIAALLHDVGRFYEVGNDRKGFRHGYFGAENVLKNEEDVTNPFILLPVKYHDRLCIGEEFFDELSKYKLSREEEGVVLKLLKLTRDSDKLANLEVHPKKIDVEFAFYMDKRPYFSENCLNSFKSRKLVDNRERETVFDQILGYMAWVYDLQFEVSKNVVFERNLLIAFLNVIEREIKSIGDLNDKFMSDFEFIKKQLVSDGLLSL